ncbi:MAG: type II toxin-antitoxin system prevent-host-death family antitoxin [Oceanobacter sp.]
MDAISHTTAKANLASIMTSVCDDHVPVAITREGEAPVVMISLADYNAMQETMYLLGTPANARELLESIAELESGNGTKNYASTPKIDKSST